MAAPSHAVPASAQIQSEPYELTLADRARLQQIANRHQGELPSGHNSEGVAVINYQPDELFFLHGLAERLDDLSVLVEQLKLYEEVLLTGKFDDGTKAEVYTRLADDSLERCRRIVDRRYPIPSRRGKLAVR